MKLNRILRCINPIVEPITIKHNRHCIKCKHFVLSNSKCQKFKQQDFIMGDMNDISAEICRKDENKCGFHAAYYNEIGKEEEEKRYKEMRFATIMNFSQLVIVSCTIQTLIIITIFR